MSDARWVEIESSIASAVRHVAARAYDDFDWQRAARAVGYARQLAEELPEEISRFRQAIDP